MQTAETLAPRALRLGALPRRPWAMQRWWWGGDARRSWRRIGRSWRSSLSVSPPSNRCGKTLHPRRASRLSMTMLAPWAGLRPAC